jgi:hypothetical protein
MEDTKNKTVLLTLTVAETDQILAAISQQKLVEVIDLFNKIREQALAQLKPKEEE